MSIIKRIGLILGASAVMLFGGISVSADVIDDPPMQEIFFEEDIENGSSVYDEESGGNGLTAFIFAVIVSGITVGIMVSGMKTIRPEIVADKYAGSLGLTQSKDVFLYSKVEKKKREKKQ